MKIEDIDNKIEEFDLEQYGIGVPAGFGLLWLALLYRAFSGIAAYGQMTDFGKFGLLVVLGLSCLALWLSGYSYARVDTSKFLLTEEEDKPEIVPAEE